MVELKITTGHTLLLDGPGQIRLRYGVAECFGTSIPLDQWITVERFHRVPMLSLDSSLFELEYGSGAVWKEVNETTIPASWSEAAQVLEQQGGVVVVVGEIDSGKSSLCTYLANKCKDAGRKVGLVDGDVGQADIGPPATVSAGVVVKPITSLQDLSPDRSFFIGDTSPSSATGKIVRSMTNLKDDLVKSCETVIVNTDGWMADFGAVQFKTELLNNIGPDLLLGLGQTREVDSILDLVKSTSLRLPISQYAKIRSKDERKKTREAGYRRFLNNSTILNLRRENVRLRMFDQPKQYALQPSFKLRGCLSGLLKKDAQLLSIARIRDLKNDNVVVEAQNLENPTFLEVGNILLSSKYEEVGYRTLH